MPVGDSGHKYLFIQHLEGPKTRQVIKKPLCCRLWNGGVSTEGTSSNLGGQFGWWVGEAPWRE